MEQGRDKSRLYGIKKSPRVAAAAWGFFIVIFIVIVRSDKERLAYGVAGINIQYALSIPVIKVYNFKIKNSIKIFM